MSGPFPLHLLLLTAQRSSYLLTVIVLSPCPIHHTNRWIKERHSFWPSRPMTERLNVEAVEDAKAEICRSQGWGRQLLVPLSSVSLSLLPLPPAFPPVRKSPLNFAVRSCYHMTECL